MKLCYEYDTLLIVGAWNRAIFTPDWVNKYVFPGEKVTIEFPVNNPDASPRYSSNGISVFIVNQKLVFKIANPTKEKYIQIGTKAIAVCRALAHTPLVCFGINHYFECTKDEIDALKIFTTNNEKLNEYGYILKAMSNQQTLNFEHHILNIIWTLNNDKGSLEFNNHYEIKDVESFIEIFDEKLLSDRLDNSVSFIKNIYNIKVES